MQSIIRSAPILITLTTLLFASAVAANPVCDSAASDSDGDGFGWENNATCIVNGATNVSSGSATTGAASSSGVTSTGSSSAFLFCQNASSDSDGDGFGWESNRSCRIASSSSSAGSTPALISSTAKPACVFAGSDPDGDGFGWENNQSCIASITSSNNTGESSNVISANNELAEEKVAMPLPSCSDQRFDSTGDGYGWENSRSCTLRNAGDGGRSITDVVLVTGQSNALGAETIPYSPYNLRLDSPVRRVYAYSQNGWGIASLQQIWDRGWYPRSDIDQDPANNFAFHFGKKLVRNNPDAVVGIIMVTMPGAGISHWDAEGEFLAQINTRVRAALAALPGDARVSGILWHQGETDYYGNDYYSNKLQSLIGNFRAQDWFADDGVFVCGETLNAPVNARLNALNTDGNRLTGCVSGNDLESVGDEIHFNAASLRTLGARYAQKYQALTK